MNLIKTLLESESLSQLDHRSADEVKNAFFSNYLAALLFLKTRDDEGMLLLKKSKPDPNQRFSASMSSLSFWGRALFNPDDAQVKKRLQHGHAEVLEVQAGRITAQRAKEIFKLLTDDPDTINWTEVIAWLVLLKHRFSVKSSYYNQIGLALQRWEKLSSSARKKTMADSILYLMQSDPTSNLLGRMRSLSSESLLDKAKSALLRVVGFKRIMEDDGGDGGGTGVGDIGTSDTQINNAIVMPPGMYFATLNNKGSSTPKGASHRRRAKYVFKDNKIVRRMKKKFKARKFKRPEPGAQE